MENERPSNSDPTHTPVGNDNEKNQPGNGENGEPAFIADLIMGIRFYSRLPSGTLPHIPPSLNKIAPLLGITSLIIGLIPVLVFIAGAVLGFSPLLVASFAVTAQIIVTGAMAEDALADSADGLWGGKNPQQRLTIMRDARHGTYGVLALVLSVIIRIAALASLFAQSGFALVFLWLAAQVIARQGALWLPFALDAARKDGLAHGVGGIKRGMFATGGGAAFLIFLVLSTPIVGIFGVVITALTLILIIYGWQRMCTKLVNGYTGDLIGGLQNLLEFVALSTFILFV